jgi:hypothetical protein
LSKEISGYIFGGRISFFSKWARPHPNLLPRGEGTAIARFLLGGKSFSQSRDNQIPET